MTTLDPPQVEGSQNLQRVEPKVAIKEARRRQRRRWLTVGALALVVATGASVASVAWGAAGTHPRTLTTHVARVGTTSRAGGFQVRPVLCYAPAYQPGAALQPTGGTLPSCGVPYLLTESQLGVSPSSNQSAGFSANNVQADPGFATIPSTRSGANQPTATVLLRGLLGAGPAARYVLGPAALTSRSVASAVAFQAGAGQWFVDVRLTGAGSTAWDTLAHAYFHRILAIVMHGTVLSAPITEPSQTSFASFNGQLEVSGDFTPTQAKALAAEITRSANR